LPWLVSQCLKAGVVFKRAIFSHVSEAAAPGVHHLGSTSDLIINCTGLSSLKLGGVEDQSLFPVRGQIVVVRNDPGGTFSISGSDDSPDETAYIMKRAAGGGTVLGGCTQKGVWEPQFDPNLSIRIMTRCVDLCPRLTGGRGIEHLDIVRHGVGLRPNREDGARVEKEKIDGGWVVHNYGHGGRGYESSYGCAKAAVKLVEEALQGGMKL
jgi:D-amino-acid oxidase